MNRFLFRLRTAWMFLTKYPVTLLPDNYWTDADAKAWSNFLGTDTGAKLRHLRWNRVYESQQKAIMDRSDPAFAAGIAFGVRGMTAEEDALLRIELSQLDIPAQESSFRSINR